MAEEKGEGKKKGKEGKKIKGGLSMGGGEPRRGNGWRRCILGSRVGRGAWILGV